MTQLSQMLWPIFTTSLQRLDPALFQNIILGVLAIFIPFAIVFLTDILNSKQVKRSEFEKMILSDEVLGTKKVFWLSIGGIVFFAFFSGVDTSSSAKIVSIIGAIVLVILFWNPFKKILRFSEGYRPEFEIPFLKKLKFSKIFFFNNKIKSEKIFRSWNSFWSDKSEIDERDFTKVFISHIDDSIKYKKFDLSVSLAQIYTKNIDNRDSFSIEYEILPKILEWNQILWSNHQLWLKAYDNEKKIQNFFSQKYFPTFSDLTLKIYKKLNSKNERYWNWHYFGGDFFQIVTKKLLSSPQGSYQLFTALKEHISESEKKLDTIADSDEKKKYWRYITDLFSSFCNTFFNEINNSPSSYDIWDHDFPPEWKISISNKENRISHIMLYEFLNWSRDRIFKKGNGDEFDKSLTEVINGIFPNIHGSLFTAFLMLFFSHEVKYSLEREPNFYILGPSVSWSSSINESKAETNKQIANIIKIKDISQREETIQIILKFFDSWHALSFYKDDLSKNELKNWKSYPESRRIAIVKKIRIKKLKKIAEEVESKEIKEICKTSEPKEMYRKDFLELIELLISEIEK